MLDDNNLNQVVGQPTRGKNILDLLLTNYPSFTNEVEVMSPLTDIADHNIVYISVSIKACINKQPLRTVYLYHRVDWPADKAATALSEAIIKTADQTEIHVQPLWDEFQTFV